MCGAIRYWGDPGGLFAEVGVREVLGVSSSRGVQLLGRWVGDKGVDAKKPSPDFRSPGVDI